MNRSRLVFLISSALILAGAVLLSPAEERTVSRKPLEPLTLAVAADLHYIAPELTDGGEYFTRIVENGDGKAMAYCEEITDAFVAEIVTQKPDVLILAGDLTFNGAKASHEALAVKLRTVENAGVPVLVIPGNHDLESSMAASFHGGGYTYMDSIDAAQFAEIYHDFGYHEALAIDKSSLSYVAALSPQLRVLMLDVNNPEAPGTLTNSTYEWARRQLEDAERQGVSVITVSHQNLLEHNSIFFGGFVMDGHQKMLALCERYGVLCHFSGHMHVQHIAESGGGMPEIAASALMTAPNQFGLMSLRDRYMNYQTIPLDFLHAEDARRFLWDTSYRRALEELPESDDELCRFFADVNTAYLAGRGDLIPWSDALYEKMRSSSTFLSLYMQSIYTDGFHDYTSWISRQNAE